MYNEKRNVKLVYVFGEFLWIILYITSVFADAIPINSSYIVLPIMFLLLGLSILSNPKIHLTQSYISMVVLSFISMLLLIVGMTINGYSNLAFKLILCQILFVIFITFGGMSFKTFKNVTHLMSAFLFLNILMNLGTVMSKNWNIGSVRNSTIVDKPIFTLIFSLSMIFILYDIYKSQKIVLSKFLMLTVLSIFSAFVIQSRTSLIILICGTVFFALKANFLKNLKLIFIIIIAIFFMSLVVSLIFPNYYEYIFKSIQSFFNNSSHMATGQQESNQIRSNLFQIGLSYFQSKPVFGIGFDTITQINLKYASVDQLESGYLEFLVYGGILFFITHVLVLVKILQNFIKGNLSELKLMLLVSIIILNIFNEYYILYYWIVLAVLFTNNNYTTTMNRSYREQL